MVKGSKLANYAALAVGSLATLASYYNLFVVQKGVPDPVGGTFDIASGTLGMVALGLAGQKKLAIVPAIPPVIVLGYWANATFLPK